MARVRLEFHYPGFNEVRTSPEVTADIHRRTDAIAAAANGMVEGGTGDDFEGRKTVNKTRARGSVITVTAEAMLAQQRDHVLERALDAGRG